MSLARIRIASLSCFCSVIPLAIASAAPLPTVALSAINTRSELNLHLGNNSGCGQGDYNTALGSSSRTHGSAASAIGSASRSQQSGLAIGAASHAALHASALGAGAHASADNSIAVGDDAQANAPYATAIGVSGHAYAYNSLALGSASQADNINSVAIGANSRTNRANSVSIGAAGNHRQLTDLSAGTQASDAVNVAQMSNSHRAMMTIEHDDIRSANTRIDHLGKLFSGQIAHLQQQMTQQHNQSNGGIASVAAMADIPYTNQQTFSTGLGVANYRNANAVAVGAQYRLTPRTDIRLASAWDNRDGEVIGAGIAYGW
ncbi:YadA-like family protein [Edwardsiella tarda]|uniref:YadA-like family protein n=2 Tax=Edwardsiella tarda TaxID=636 RepID=UPI00351C1A5B